MKQVLLHLFHGLDVAASFLIYVFQSESQRTENCFSESVGIARLSEDLEVDAAECDRAFDRHLVKNLKSILPDH